ncbi:MAG: D-alanyl-D-alanine carboxypeptidase [Alphaproteobacteria bacterium]|nr:D-alanyl-D-alanine carboxypeptidase [Alphaproteobacteria bacterium]
MTFPAIRRFALAAALIAGTAPAFAQTIETQAKQAYIVDMKTGAVLLEKNANELMPPSSMSKIMTVHMLFEKLQKGEVKLTDEFPVSERAWRIQGSKMFVPLGSRVKVEDLIRGIVVQSGNDACIVVAEALAGSEEAFSEQMTKRGREFGLTKTVFKNSSGWPHPEHVTTARELALIAKHTIEMFPEYYKYYAELNYTFNGIKQGNRNPLLYKPIGADGLKTGHTEAAGYGLTASVKRGDRRIIMVVNGLPSMKERAQETEGLIDWAFREYENYALFKAGEPVQNAGVWLGEAKTVPLVAADDLVVTLPRRARQGMKVTAVFQEPIPSPIQKGQQAGKLVIAAPGVPTKELPLIAGESVAQLGPAGRIGAAVSYLIFGAQK